LGRERGKKGGGEGERRGRGVMVFWGAGGGRRWEGEGKREGEEEKGRTRIPMSEVRWRSWVHYAVLYKLLT